MRFVVFLALVATQVIGQNSFGPIDVTPKSIPVNVPTVVTATAVIPSPALLPDGANLQRVDSAGRVITTYGPMRDDGKEGDEVAGDRKFTLRVTLNEKDAGAVNLRVAAAFQGQLIRVFSGLMTVTVTGTPAPKITITSPENLAYLNLSPTTVSGTVDIATATVKINEVNAPVNAGRFSAAVPLAEGPNILTVTATAPGAPVATASITVTLDTTPPRVTLTAPPDGFATSATSVNVAGIVNDIVVGTINELQASVTVNGRPAEVANRTFLAKDVPLNLGENTITAAGRDRAGNSFTTSIKVRRDPPPPPTAPTIRIVSGNNQSGPIGAPAAEPLVVSVMQGTTPVAGRKVIFKVLQNNALIGTPPAPNFAATTNASGQASVPLTLGERAGAGGNIIEAYAVGVEGTVQFTATSTPSVAGQIVVDSGNGQTGAVGQNLPKPFIAVVIDKGHNRLRGVPVTFTVKSGGGNFGGKDALTVTTDSDGRAAATLTLGLQEGRENNLIEANFPGNTGYAAVFTASGRLPGDPAATRVSGVVLDNSNQPLPGVTIRVAATHTLTMNSSIVATLPSVKTNDQGQFSIAAPVGYVKLLVDGSTTAKPGKYPSLDYDLVTVAGQTSTVGQPIYLLPIKEENRLCVTATSGGGTLTIPEAPGFSLSFRPNQITFPGGSKEGCVSVTVVHSDKVPMVPGFGQQPRFIVTIQPAGAVFNPPAEITLPNVDGLKPNAVTEMYSFDHDIGSFVAIGTGQVSDDGLTIRSSPGVGVLKAGWHCGGNPAARGHVANCPQCQFCEGPTASLLACVAHPGLVGAVCGDRSNPCLQAFCGGTLASGGAPNMPTGICEITYREGACSLPGGLTGECRAGVCIGEGEKCPSACRGGRCVNGVCITESCTGRDGATCSMGGETPGICRNGQCVGRGSQCPTYCKGTSCLNGVCTRDCSNSLNGYACNAGGRIPGVCINGKCQGDDDQCPASCEGRPCSDGSCKNGILEITSVETPSRISKPLPPTNGSFIAPADQINLAARVRFEPSLDSVIRWEVVPKEAHTGALSSSPGSGPALSFTGVSRVLATSDPCGNPWFQRNDERGGRDRPERIECRIHPPLEYSVAATASIRGESQRSVLSPPLPLIKQDLVDILRQEYVDFGAPYAVPRERVSLPSSPQFIRNPAYPYLYEETPGTLETMITRLETELSAILFNDQQKLDPGKDCPTETPDCVVVAPGPDLKTAGTCTGSTTRCPDGSDLSDRIMAPVMSRPEVDDVCVPFDGNPPDKGCRMITAGRNKKADTRANNLRSMAFNLRIAITNAYRTPQRNFDLGSNIMSQHIRGNAIDFDPSRLSIGPKAQTLCALEMAGDRAFGANNSYVEKGPTTFIKCGNPSATHAHIEAR